MTNRNRDMQRMVKYLTLLFCLCWGSYLASTVLKTVQASNLFGGSGPTSMMVDFIPGDSENIVRASSGRVIPIAIFGSSDLNVTSINPRTIRLNGVDVMLVGKSDKSLCRKPDINDDGFPDLVCDVRTTGFKVGEGEFRVILKAGTYNGKSLKGEDRIRVVND